MPSLKILIAAGGTGGHIYPALAIADAFLNKLPEARIEFVGTRSGLENKIIPGRGFRLHHLPIGRLNSNVSVGERLKTLLSMPLAFLKSIQILFREKPDLVLGVGGHASGPLLLMAALFRFHTVIWEPNAMPGLTNRWLAKFVDDCWVVFAEAKPFLKTRRLHQAGMPVRAEIEDMVMPAHSYARASGEPFRILVFGGSQGARGINNTVLEMAQAHPAWLKDVQLVHQTGSADFARVREGYQGLPVDVREYLHDMGAQYARADLVVCRSGTGTLSELAACGKPAILIPLPTAADDHQRKNAESLVAQDAAVMIVQKDLSAAKLFSLIEDLRQHPERLRRMSEAVRGFHRSRAAAALVAGFLERLDAHAPR